jgi:hypothetical protein
MTMADGSGSFRQQNQYGTAKRSIALVRQPFLKVNSRLAVNKIGEDYSLTAISKILGRAKSGMHKLAKSGQIPKQMNGRYNLAAVQAALAANIEPGRARGGRRVHLAQKPPSSEHAPEEVNTPDAKPIETLTDAAKAVSLIRQILENEGVKVGAAIDFQGARTAELILKAHALAQKLDVEAGRLCNKSEVMADIFKMARADRDRLMNWPSQVGALIAHELGSETVKTIIVLENYIRQYLIEISDPELCLERDRKVVDA